MESKSINQHYTEDHHHLHALLQGFQSLKVTNRPEARKAFQEFKSELERHILWEERILFPWFEHKLGHLKDSPLPILHREHEQILVSLDDIARKLAQENCGTDNDEKNLEMALRRHNEKEEQDLFPALDKILSDQERTAVFGAMGGRGQTAFKEKA